MLRSESSPDTLPKRRRLRHTWFLACLLLPTTVLAAAGDCHAIKDHDQRRYCLGVVRKSSGDCYAVRQSDLRQFCLAQVQRQSSRCYSIRDPGNRRQCLAMLR